MAINLIFHSENSVTETTKSNWNSALKAVSEYNTTPVVYCFVFSHGLCKVGKTKNISNRMESLSCHGLLSPLLLGVAICRCEKQNLNDAEKIALQLFSQVGRKVAQEVFEFSDVTHAGNILLTSVRQSTPTIKKLIPTDNSGMWAFAHQHGIDEAIELEAFDIRFPQTVDDCIDFANHFSLDNFDSQENEIIDKLQSMHPFAAIIAPHFFIINAILFYNNFDAQKRIEGMKTFANESLCDLKKARATHQMAAANYAKAVAKAMK